MELNLDRKVLLEKSKENKDKLIEEEIANIKEAIENAVSRGLEGVAYALKNEHSHIKEDLVNIITASGLTAKVVTPGIYCTAGPVNEITISWKDESGIELI